jgi:hypothetical protein
MNLRKDIKFSEISSGLKDAVKRARLSRFEAAFLAAAIAFCGLVAIFYFYSVQPLSSQLGALGTQEQDLVTKLEKNSKDLKARADQSTNAEKILDSLGRFQAMLKPDERGMTQIINEINALSKTHNVYAGDAGYRLTEAEATTDENGNPLPPKKIAERKINIYPALGIDTTVVGDYPNLRRFLAELERSRQFLIINGLSFQGGDDKLVRAMAKGGKPLQLSTPDAVPVSVKIELDTYFQAPASSVTPN